MGKIITVSGALRTDEVVSTVTLCVRRRVLRICGDERDGKGGADGASSGQGDGRA